MFITTFSLAQKAPTPELNLQIVKIIKSNINKTIDRGECWDLANLVLSETNAKWDHQFGFGREIKYSIDSIYAGDIIQFTNAKIQMADGVVWRFGQHTAIIYEIDKNKKIKIAHQNVNNVRKVIISDFEPEGLIEGKLKIYRPIK